MRFRSLEEIIQFINIYLQHDVWDKKFTIENLIAFIKQQKSTERVLILAELGQLLQQTHRKVDIDIDKRRQIFKEAINRIQRANWKNTLLNTRLCQTLSLFYTPLVYDNRADQEIQFTSSRFAKREVDRKNAALMGSSFVTSKSTMQHTEGSHVLDAIFSAYKFTDHDNEELIVALADGCGGHFRVTTTHYANPELSSEKKAELVSQTNLDFEFQDNIIARAAHFATKHAVRLLATYDNPQQLIADILSLVRNIEREVMQKAPNEATTLVCARAFATTNGYRVVGFNIGDSMLAAWNPIYQAFLTLAPSIISMPHAAQEATAQIPKQYHEFEVHMINTLVPEGTIIFPLSDGYVDYLPQEVIMRQYPNGLNYKEVTLDTMAMREILITNLSADSTMTDYLNQLTEIVISKVNEQRREELINPETREIIQLGDDMAGAALLLPPINQPEDNYGLTCILQ